MNDHDLNEIVGKKLFGLQLQDSHAKGYPQMKYLGPDSGWYCLREWATDPELLIELLNEIERMGWALEYKTMKNGERGYFVKLHYSVSQFDSALYTVESKGNTFNHALCLAVAKI